MITTPVTLPSTYVAKNNRGSCSQGRSPLHNAPMANRIVELRKARGISQRKLAGLVDTSFQQIYKLEKGINPLTQEWMERIAAALGVRPAALIDADAERLPDPEVESEFVDDPDELALLWLWRGVSDDMKTAALTILRNSMRRSGNAETI